MLNTFSRHQKSLLACAAFLLYSSVALADGPDSDASAPADDNGFTILSNATNVTRWGLGAGVGLREEPYKQDGKKALPIPVFFFDDKWVHITGTNVDLKVAKWNSLSFSLRGRYAFGNVYSGGDSAALAGMHNRKGGFWIGPAGEWRTPYGTLSADFLTGANRGDQAHLRFGEPLAFGSLSVEPHVGVEWLSQKNVDYYYGVRSSEVRPGRSQYTGSSTENVSLGTRFTYKLAPNQSLTLDLDVTRLGSSIAESPIVSRRYTPQLGLGYLYEFQ